MRQIIVTWKISWITRPVTHAIVHDGAIILSFEIVADSNHTTHTPPAIDGLFELSKPYVETSHLVSDVCNGGIKPLFQLIESTEDES